MSWDIRTNPTTEQIIYRRRGDHEDQTAPLWLKQLILDLEHLESHTPDWCVRHTALSPAQPNPRLWARYPGVTVVHADSVEELREQIHKAQKTLVV